MTGKVILVLAVCIAVTSAKLCLPTQWQGKLLGTAGQYVDRKVQILSISATEYSDFSKNMSSFVEEVLVEGNVLQITLINDFNKMKTYIIDREKKTCKTIPVLYPQFRQYCEGDDDFKLVESFTLGGRPAGMYKAESGSLKMEMTLMRDDFSRVSSLSELTVVGVPQINALQYGNYSNKITDKGVFDVPSFCQDEIHQEQVKVQRKCAPEQYETVSYGKIAQVAGGTPMVLPLSIKSSYDYTNKMEASESEVIYNGKEIRGKTITDWKKQIIYVINADQPCQKLPTPTPKMIEFCTDNPQFKHIAEFTTSGKLVDMYRLDVVNVSTTFSVFRDSFYLVTSVIEQRILGYPQLLAVQYGNTTLGIADRSVFNIPASCKP